MTEYADRAYSWDEIFPVPTLCLYCRDIELKMAFVCFTSFTPVEEWIVFLLRVYDVIGSDLDLTTGCPNRSFSQGFP